jgi:hypothetical protein
VRRVVAKHRHKHLCGICAEYDLTKAIFSAIGDHGFDCYLVAKLHEPHKWFFAHLGARWELLGVLFWLLLDRLDRLDYFVW